MRVLKISREAGLDELTIPSPAFMSALTLCSPKITQVGPGIVRGRNDDKEKMEAYSSVSTRCVPTLIYVTRPGHGTVSQPCMRLRILMKLVSVKLEHFS